MTAATAYCRSTIMQSAWDRTKAVLARNPGANRLSIFRRHLSEAWLKEKGRLRNARRAVRLATMDEAALRAMLDRVSNYKPLADDFHPAQIYKALEHLEQKQDREAKRDVIEAAPRCVVTFTKKDGSERRMVVTPGKVNRKPNAPRSAQIAATTRKTRHPHLMPVWDAEAKAMKSVNLATVTRIETPSQVHTY